MYKHGGLLRRTFIFNTCKRELLTSHQFFLFPIGFRLARCRETEILNLCKGDDLLCAGATQCGLDLARLRMSSHCCKMLTNASSDPV